MGRTWGTLPIPRCRTGRRHRPGRVCRRRVDGVLVAAVAAEEVRMMACPWEVVRPDVGDPILLVDLEPAPQDVQFRCSSDEAPASGGFLHKAVEAEEQEDVAAANALLVQVALCDARLAEHTSPLLPVGAVLPVPICVEVEVGVQVDSSLSPFMRPLVIPVTTLAMSMSPCWRSCELLPRSLQRGWAARTWCRRERSGWDSLLTQSQSPCG